MAENPGENKNSKGIGELFVEFGTKGLPTMLKQLNGISASFLLGKNAASQFAQMLTKPMKEAGNAAVEVGKLSSALGTTKENIAKMQYYFKKRGLSESLLGDLAKTQANLDLIWSGRGELAAGFIDALNQIDLSAQNYKGTFEDIIRLYKDVQVNTDRKMANRTMTQVGRSRILRQLDWSEEHGYAWDRGGFNLADALSLPDDIYEKNIKTAENLAEFEAAMKSLTDLLVAKLLPQLTDFVNGFTGFVKDIIGGKDVGDKISKAVEDNAGKIGAVAAVKGHPVAGAAIVGAGNLAKEQRTLGGTTGKTVPQQFGAAPLDFGVAPWIKNKGTATGGAAPVPDFMNTSAASVPPNIANLTQNINITNQNSITGDNPSEIVRAITGINSQDIQYSQAQLTNLPGL